MTSTLNYLPEIETLLPETAALLKESALVVHPGVSRIVVSGSRGVRGNFRPDSDLDLSLIIDSAMLPSDDPDRARFLRDVLDMTLQNWQSRADVDLAAVFSPDGGDGLRLFELRDYDAAALEAVGRSSIGLYKTQKGFAGYVPNEVLDFEKIYPLLTIWRR